MCRWRQTEREYPLRALLAGFVCLKWRRLCVWICRALGLPHRHWTYLEFD